MTWCPEVLIPQLRVQAEQAPYDSLKWQLNSLAHALEREVERRDTTSEAYLDEEEAALAESIRDGDRRDLHELGFEHPRVIPQHLIKALKEYRDRGGDMAAPTRALCVCGISTGPHVHVRTTFADPTSDLRGSDHGGPLDPGSTPVDPATARPEEGEVRGAGSGEVRGLFDRRTHTRQSPAHPHSSASSAEGLQPTEEPYLTSENAEPSAADNRTSHLFEVVREFLDLVEAFIDPPRPGKTGDIEH